MCDNIILHNTLDISQRENNYKESEIFNVFPLEGEHLVQSSPPSKNSALMV